MRLVAQSTETREQADRAEERRHVDVPVCRGKPPQVAMEAFARDRTRRERQGDDASLRPCAVTSYAADIGGDALGSTG